jgi:hypothetical protein
MIKKQFVMITVVRFTVSPSTKLSVAYLRTRTGNWFVMTVLLNNLIVEHTYFYSVSAVGDEGRQNYLKEAYRLGKEYCQE